MSFNVRVGCKYFFALFLALGTALECFATSPDMATGVFSMAEGGAPAPTQSLVISFFCNKGGVLGAGTELCTVYIRPTSTQTTVVNLSSNNAAITLPATVSVAANATNVQFTANVTAVTTTQTVTLTASLGGESTTYNINLLAAVPGLALPNSNVTFPNLALNSSETSSMALMSTGTVPVTINAAVTGAGFSITSPAFPITLNPGQQTPMTLKFSPTTPGPSTGLVTLTTNAITKSTQTINLTGSVPAVNLIFCATSQVVGTATDLCNVTLTAHAPATGMTVNLSSNNAAVVLPASVVIPANANIAPFTATISPVATAQTVTLTASTSGVSKTSSLQLLAATQAMLVLNKSLAFPDEVVNTASPTQTVTIASTGSVPITVDATVTGSAFVLVGATLPVTIAHGQSVILKVQFAPVVAATVSGTLNITSNSPTTPTFSVALAGKGTAVGTFPGSQVASMFSPPNPSAPISKDFFGMAISNLAPNSPHPAPNMTPFPTSPVSLMRVCCQGWQMMEPTQGQYNWVKYDNSFAIAQKNGVTDFIFAFGNVPNWASTNPSDPCTNGMGPGSCSPPNMQDYDDIATRVVQRYCGVIKYYEPWNEPNNVEFWDGTNAQMLTISQHTYNIVKDPANCGCTNGTCSPGGGVNPNKVLLPPIAELTPASIAWLSSYLAAAGSPYPYADIATFHGYVWSGYGPESIIGGVQSLQQTLATYGLGEIPIWNTETSWQWNSEYTAPQQASWLMRTHVADAVAGVSRLVWFSYDNCSWGTLWSSPLCTSNPGPYSQLTQGGAAYGVIETWLTGANLTHCEQYEDGLWACELKRPGGYDSWMLWSSTTASISVTIPSTLNLTVYRDSQSNLNSLPSTLTITNMPVLLETQDLQPQAATMASKL